MKKLLCLFLLALGTVSVYANDPREAWDIMGALLQGWDEQSAAESRRYGLSPRATRQESFVCLNDNRLSMNTVFLPRDRAEVLFTRFVMTLRDNGAATYQNSYYPIFNSADWVMYSEHGWRYWRWGNNRFFAVTILVFSQPGFSVGEVRLQNYDHGLMRQMAFSF